MGIKFSRIVFLKLKIVELLMTIAKKMAIKCDIINGPLHLVLLIMEK